MTCQNFPWVRPERIAPLGTGGWGLTDSQIRGVSHIGSDPVSPKQDKIEPLQPVGPDD